MRGTSLLVGIALAVGLLVTSAASAAVQVDDSGDTLDDQMRDSQATIDRLLPRPVETPAATAFDASLPGEGAPLTVDEGLMATAPVAPQLAVDQATGSPDAPSLDGGDSGSPTTAVGAIEPAEATDERLPDYVTSDASVDEGGSGDESAATQSQAASSADTRSSAAEAWDSLDKEEKAAATAGALGLLLLGPLTMYSRIQRDDALENDTRREIYEIVEDNPGVCIQEAADQADVSYSTASYHLKRLVKMDYVTRCEDGNKVLYYKNGGTFTAEERDLIPILQTEEAMRVFHHIVENPWCYRAQVAEALDVSHTTVNWHLDRLQDADLVEEHREGRSCHLNVNEDALDRVVSTMEKLETEAGTPVTVEPTAQAAPA